jgi:hypothetical protein
MLEKESKTDALALAFAGEPCSPQEVARLIVDAIETRPDEIYLPPERGEAVRKLGVDIKALREHVEKNTAIGWEKLQQRRQVHDVAS